MSDYRDNIRITDEELLEMNNRDLRIIITNLYNQLDEQNKYTARVYAPNKSYKELEEKLVKADDLRKKDIDELWETRIVPLQNQVKEKDNLLDVANHKSQCQDSRIKQLQQIIKNLETRIDFAVGYISATQPHTDKHPMEVKRWLFEGFERMKDEI